MDARGGLSRDDASARVSLSACRHEAQPARRDMRDAANGGWPRRNTTSPIRSGPH